MLPASERLARIDPELVRRLAAVRLAAFDVDGTLTSGQVVYIGDQELQSYCVYDGQGLAWLRKAGVTLAWITGRGCASTERRAKELGVEHLHMRSGPKESVLRDVQQRAGIGPDATLAMGDDLPDLAMARAAGLFVAPASARLEVQEAADFVTGAEAGSGAVRELAELLLAARGLWDAAAGGLVQ